MNIVSNFKDYYDEFANSMLRDGITYERFENTGDKSEELSYISNLGIETIKLMPVASVVGADKLVVYTNPALHRGKGKQVLSYIKAIQMYGNKLCSEFVPGNEKTYKIVQIGLSRYSCVLENKGLEEQRIIGYTRLKNCFCELLDLPIYSIDYIKINNKFVACDFNKVQRLADIGFEQVLREEELVQELIKYYSNKKHK